MLLSGNRRSVVAMLAACAFFAGMDAFMKALSAHYSPLQVTTLRGMTALPLIALYILWRGEWRAVVHRRLRWGLHVLRGLAGVALLALFTTALRTLGLAEAYTLSFIAPMLITLLAVPILGERVRAWHLLCTGLGFIGVLVALRPGQAAFASVGSLAALGAAGCYALHSVLGRLISRTEPSASLVLWTLVSMTVFGGLLAWPQWTAVQAEHALLLAGLAVTGFLGQLTISEAFRHGQAAVVAPFEYSALGWAVLIDWVFWHAVPDGWTLGGAAIIIASGLLMLRGQIRLARAAHPDSRGRHRPH